MRVIRSVFVCAAFAAGLGSSAAAWAADNQKIIISFDGAHDNAVWERSFALAEKSGAKFTYFLSCVFLLSSETKHLYVDPQGRRGRSNVGFATSKADVAARLQHIWRAHRQGHEIASHGCGHFDGGKWSKEEWTHEFNQAATILRDAWTINGIDGQPAGWDEFAREAMRGFRAPYLSTGPGLYRSMVAGGFRYDASAVSKGPAGEEHARGLTRFALPLIPEGPQGRNVIAMDYNLFARHTRARETEDAGGVFEQRTHDAFMAAFNKQYNGKRIPLQIGYHFTLMNGGAYWRALERFASEVCRKPDVDCVSYAMTMEGPTASIEAHLEDASLEWRLRGTTN